VLETQSGPLRSVQKDEAWPKTRLCDAGLTLVGVLPRASCGFACWHSTSRRRALVEAKETSFLTLGARQIDPIPCAARGGQVCRLLGADTRNEPVVCEPQEALGCSLRRKMGMLVMEKYCHFEMARALTSPKLDGFGADSDPKLNRVRCLFCQGEMRKYNRADSMILALWKIWFA